jgi:radical SAM enzyme (TIGR01210 family)
MSPNTDHETLAEYISSVYSNNGSVSTMHASPPPHDDPLFFMLRHFGHEVDLLIILNTLRCRYQCYFCQLPAKSSRTPVSHESILSQVKTVIHETKNALALIQRMTLSNEGSVLDQSTLDHATLIAISDGVGRMRRLKHLVLETRLEFANAERLREVADHSGAQVTLLTGFETLDETLRQQVLGKREPIEMFLRGLDELAHLEAPSLTAYVLIKPSAQMTDAEAVDEASSSILFLKKQCTQRRIRLSLRLNPMYAARGSKWVSDLPDEGFIPPRLTDVIMVAEKAVALEIPTYIGLSSEDLAQPELTYQAREDYSRDLLRYALAFNREYGT